MKIYYLSIILALFVVACVPQADQPIAQIPTEDTATQTPTQTGGLQQFTAVFGGDVTTKQFASDQELLSFIRTYSGSDGGYSPFYARGMMTKGGVMMESAVAFADAAVPMAKPMAPGTDYSTTNVQVAGVDEADILKTDGEYIYTITNQILYLIEAYPGEDAKVVGTIKFDQAPQGIFIDGDKLAVFGSFYKPAYFRKMGLKPRYGMSFFNIYDISDKTDPQLAKEYKFEGNYLDGRMSGDDVYFVTTSGLEARPMPTPFMIEGDVVKQMPISDVFYCPIPYNNPLYVNIHGINLQTEKTTSSKSIVVEGSQQMYMSGDNIYLTYTEYINEWEIRQEIMKDMLQSKLTAADKAFIAKIETTDDEILSRWEKESKIFQIYSDQMEYMDDDERQEFEDDLQDKVKGKLKQYEHMEYTIINRIEVDGGSITPAANGKVPGHIMSQFSMDEYDGVFRIATTISAQWFWDEKRQQESTNNVYTLSDDLSIMDELEDLAEGEQIYSTRFMGDRLYMVTFRQVDPFFVIDLSNPNSIMVLGKLKIPGFSRYLHPYDENTIIGIGQDATDSGRVKGLKISLFDVRNVEQPKEIAKYVTEERYASSNALYEHKAFLFSKEKELLVIPVYSYDYENQGESYNGAFVFKIGKDEIKLRGLIEHKSDNYYSPSVERSLFIQELLYTKSPNLLRINKLSDLSKVKNVELTTAGGDIPRY